MPHDQHNGTQTKVPVLPQTPNILTHFFARLQPQNNYTYQRLTLNAEQRTMEPRASGFLGAFPGTRLATTHKYGTVAVLPSAAPLFKTKHNDNDSWTEHTTKYTNNVQRDPTGKASGPARCMRT